LTHTWSGSAWVDALIWQVHRAHVTSIRSRNLDPHRGVPVSLGPELVERKLVAARRGGYCFEQSRQLRA
jgi:arylamine N-acetyltransferase